VRKAIRNAIYNGFLSAALSEKYITRIKVYIVIKMDNFIYAMPLAERRAEEAWSK
jgi:hypothetical protein